MKTLDSLSVLYFNVQRNEQLQDLFYYAAYRFTTSSRKSWTTSVRRRKIAVCIYVETSLLTDMDR